MVGSLAVIKDVKCFVIKLWTLKWIDHVIRYPCYPVTYPSYTYRNILVLVCNLCIYSIYCSANQWPLIYYLQMFISLSLILNHSSSTIEQMFKLLFCRSNKKYLHECQNIMMKDVHLLGHSSFLRLVCWHINPF